MGAGSLLWNSGLSPLTLTAALLLLVFLTEGEAGICSGCGVGKKCLLLTHADGETRLSRVTPPWKTCRRSQSVLDPAVLCAAFISHVIYQASLQAASQ